MVEFAINQQMEYSIKCHSGCVYIYIHMCGKVEPSIEWDLKLYSMRYYFRVVLISNRIEDMTLYNQLDKIDQCF